MNISDIWLPLLKFAAQKPREEKCLRCQKKDYDEILENTSFAKVLPREYLKSIFII